MATPLPPEQSSDDSSKPVLVLSRKDLRRILTITAIVVAFAAVGFGSFEAGRSKTPANASGEAVGSTLPVPTTKPGASSAAGRRSSAPTSCPVNDFPTGYFGPAFVGPLSRTFTHSQRITEFSGAGGSYVQVCYPAGSTVSGAQAKLTIAGGPRTTATLTYQVRFPVGFQFVKGGKMPGLCGGQCWTGSNNGPGGWSTRYMWRAGGVAEVLLSDATTTGYGTDLFRNTGDWKWQADGQWHTIAQTVVMNTPGKADGSITVSYDGVQVAQQTGVTFRAAGDTDAIDSMIFTTFFGGHDSSWAPSSNQVIDWRDFTVS
jgi:hypothetical protein